VTLIALVVVVCLSIYSMRDEWICELDSDDPKHDVICRELRKAVNCRTTVASPIRAETNLIINNQVKASSLTVCGWDIASSELRVCFVLVSIACVIVGMNAVKNENKKKAELHAQLALFFGILLLIAGFFDWVAISDSQTNNYSLCNLKDEFTVDKNVQSESMICSYGVYYLTSLATVISGGMMIFSSITVNQWKTTIVSGLD